MKQHLETLLPNFKHFPSSEEYIFLRLQVIRIMATRNQNFTFFRKHTLKKEEFGDEVYDKNSAFSLSCPKAYARRKRPLGFSVRVKCPLLSPWLCFCPFLHFFFTCFVCYPFFLSFSVWSSASLSFPFSSLIFIFLSPLHSLSLCICLVSLPPPLSLFVENQKDNRLKIR